MSQDKFANLRNFNYVPFDEETNSKYTLAEYIWIDGTGKNLRSKTKVYLKKIEKLEDLEWWNYDGSSTGQATTNASEIQIKPVAFFPDPFRKKPHILVLCETFLSDGKTPAKANFRNVCEKVMTASKASDPWFGIEQEYFLFVRTGTTYSWPLGWPQGGFPYPQGRYYCGVGDFNCFGRNLTEAHLRCCLYAGLKLAGLNAEVAPAQWEFQVGITRGIECGDHMWMSRYILYRLGEELGVDIILEPKPVSGDWNGSGCHTNYSTNETRAEGGLDVIIKEHMAKLKERHMEHILVYGEANKLRLSGKHETSHISKFDFHEGNRGASIRIPVMTMKAGKGYYEDRRPGSNIDPYLVSAILVDTTILNGVYCKEIVDAYRSYAKSFKVFYDEDQMESIKSKRRHTVRAVHPLIH